MTDEIARLVELSEKATQGEWDMHTIGLRKNTEFACALVNWFRANRSKLEEYERSTQA